MKTINTIAILILFMTSLLFTGCYKWHNVDGNYNVVTETRHYSGFKRVFNEGEFDVYIIQDGSDVVEIVAESNLIPMIRTRIEGTALVIDTKDNLKNHYPMKVYVHTDELVEIRLSGSGLMHAEDITSPEMETDLSGSGNIFFSGTVNEVECTISGSGSIDMGVDCNELNTKISGSGDIELWGSADRGDLKISGSGAIRAYELILQDCYANISGSGSIYVTVEDYLNVNISGSGSVYYMGDPSIETKITGSGSLIHP